MHRICLFLFFVLLSCTAVFGQDQIVKKSEQPSINNINLQQVKQKTTTNTLNHKFVCQRCGSENQLDWAFPVDNENLQLIPHCGFCGKKYWPKFKPTGLLERTYSKEEKLSSRLGQHQGLQ